MSFRKGGSGWTSFRKEELQEEEIWGVFHERDKLSAPANVSSSPSSTAPRRLTTTAAKMIPRSNREQPIMTTAQQHSAPVNIPDWSKIYGGGGFVRSSWESDDEDGGMMPPHEWLARKYARSEMSSFSVCEGVGRTLKGRDITRVRNAVLTKTGFLE